MKNSKFIGMINLSNKVMISDPCYLIDSWCQGEIENVVPGTYNCYVLDGDVPSWGHRIKELFITNSNRPISREEINTLMDFEVGVDSGIAGIFDYDYYEKYHKDSHDDAYKAWFDKYVLKNHPDFRITSDLGVWSRSGVGDGSYECYIHCDETGSVDAIRIVFIKEENKEV